MNRQLEKNKRERITSPDQLHDYLHVTNAAVWIILGAVILLLVVSLIWASKATIDSYADATATVKEGTMVVRLADTASGKTLQSGMQVFVGDHVSTISSVGHDPKGIVYAVASTTLADGDYSARILLKKTTVLSLLFN